MGVCTDAMCHNELSTCSMDSSSGLFGGWQGLGRACVCAPFKSGGKSEVKSRKLVSSGPSCSSGRLSSTDRIACKVVNRIAGRYNGWEQAQIYAAVHTKFCYGLSKFTSF